MQPHSSWVRGLASTCVSGLLNDTPDPLQLAGVSKTYFFSATKIRKGYLKFSVVTDCSQQRVPEEGMVRVVVNAAAAHSPNTVTELASLCLSGSLTPLKTRV